MSEQDTLETPVATRKIDFADQAGSQEQSDMVADTEEVSLEELKKRQEEIERQIREKKQAEQNAIINQIVDVVQSYEIPIEVLVERLGGLKIRRQGKPAVQKYRDPVSGATWSGRGKEPLWIRGKKREKFLIEKVAPR